MGRVRESAQATRLQRSRGDRRCLIGSSTPENRLRPDKETGMALADVQVYLNLLPVVKQIPQGSLWSSYDAEADVLYVNFKKPSHAVDSELTDDDVILRYEG